MKLLRKMSRKLRRFVKHPVRSLRGLLLDAAQTVESPNMSALYLQGIKFLIAIFGTSTYLRRLGDYVALSHPIEISKPLPPISLHVVASKKDFPLLPLAVNQARIMSLNPVANVLIIVPERQRGFLPKLPPGVTVVGEEQVLSSEVFETINAHHPPGRRGWIVQQALKLWSVWNSSAEGVLVVDADTILTKKRAFLSSDKKQLLSYSHEYHGPYEEHCSRVWGLRRFDKGLSYVCHHQLMQPEILHEMFPTEDELKNWILAARIEQRSPLADYHSYGRWLVDHHPDRVARGRWGNTKSPLIRDGNSEMLQAKRLLCEVASNVFSVSFHHYLDKSKSFVRD